MKARGYRSFGNYLSRAKEQHIREGHSWSPQLDAVSKDCSRSVLRGIGPPRQSAEYPLLTVHCLDLGHQLVVTSGPVSPVQLLTLGAFFLTREIELSLALQRHITLDRSTLVVRWLLPASKTDPTAVGVTREWGCLCVVGKALPCPYHAADAHFTWLHSQFSEDGTLPEQLPLFPNLTGGHVAKCTVVDTIEHLAALAGASTVDSLGRRAFGGHSCRVTGAKYLASIDAPLASLTADCRHLLEEQRLHDTLADLRSRLQANEVQLSSLDANVRRCISEELEPLALPIQSATADPAVVRNNSSGAWHTILWYGGDMPPASWKTRCGWPFGFAQHVVAAALPDDVLWQRVCERCLPDVKATLRATAVEASTTSTAVRVSPPSTVPSQGHPLVGSACVVGAVPTQPAASSSSLPPTEPN